MNPIEAMAKAICDNLYGDWDLVSAKQRENCRSAALAAKDALADNVSEKMRAAQAEPDYYPTRESIAAAIRAAGEE